METKTCSLTEDEIKELITWHGQKLGWPDAKSEDEIERINYLNRRLKAEKKDKPEEQQQTQTPAEETKAAASW